MKNITPAQAIVLVASIIAPIVAYKLLDSTTAGIVVGSVGMLINFLLGREDEPKPPDPSQPTQLSLFEGGKK